MRGYGPLMAETTDSRLTLRDETLFPFLTVPEAATRMGISKPTLFRLMRAGKIGYTQEEGARRLIPIPEIQRYSDSLMAAMTRAPADAAA
jgi:excisionase family DNA binding protein